MSLHPEDKKVHLARVFTGSRAGRVDWVVILVSAFGMAGPVLLGADNLPCGGERAEMALARSPYALGGAHGRTCSRVADRRFPGEDHAAPGIGVLIDRLVATPIGAGLVIAANLALKKLVADGAREREQYAQSAPEALS